MGRHPLDGNRLARGGVAQRQVLGAPSSVKRRQFPAGRLDIHELDAGRFLQLLAQPLERRPQRLLGILKKAVLLLGGDLLISGLLLNAGGACALDRRLRGGVGTAKAVAYMRPRPLKGPYATVGAGEDEGAT